jgi:hypothetical protein
MRRSFTGAALFVVLALVIPAAAADKPTDKSKLPTDKKEAAAKMVAAGTLRGRVVNVEGAKKTLTVEITLTYAAPNPGAMANLANLQQQYVAARDLGTRRSLLIQMAQQQAQMATIKQEKQSLDIEASDEIVVRAANPPVQFDDKGNVKKYTAKELKALKGNNPKLPGYESDFDSLRPDQIVEIHLAKPKEQPKPKATNKDADKDALAETSKPVATMIIILADPPSK